ncbi:TPA: hypothetical protein ACYEOW_003651 [Raoultella terrigena]
MRDIYHQLVKMTSDFDKHHAEDLVECRNLCHDAAAAIAGTLTLIGNLTMSATASEDYDDEDAKRDLILLGYTLRMLPRMAQALAQNGDTAGFVLKRREGDAK